jgi:hypothetical protein
MSGGRESKGKLSGRAYSLANAKDFTKVCVFYSYANSFKVHYVQFIESSLSSNCCHSKCFSWLACLTFATKIKGEKTFFIFKDSASSHVISGKEGRAKKLVCLSFYIR